MDTLDKYDLKILSVLQVDGRISVVNLAEQIGLSKSPCLKRLRRLEKGGFIRGYRADIDPQKVMQNHLVYVQVKLSSTKMRDLAAFNAAVQDIPQIMACHMMAGGYDYLLKVRTKDIQEYRAFMGEILADLPGVLQTSSFPVMEQVKDAQYVILETEKI